MDRILTYDAMKENLNNSDMDEKLKNFWLHRHNQRLKQWCDELKERLNNYEPLFNDLDTRRSVSPSFNYQKHNLKGEIWKEFPLDKDYTVSNLGRIKYKGVIQKQKDDKVQYVTLADESLRRDYIYNFVAYTFLGKKEGDGMHVHHITNDGYYNTEENLVLLTKDEHSYVHGFEVY